MGFAICPLSIISVRSNPSQRSEQISQILFGEMVEVLDHKGKVWLKIRCVWDDLVGWVASNQLQSIAEEDYNRNRQHPAIAIDFFQPASSDEHFLPVPLGAQLPQFDGIRFKLAQATYHYSGQVIFPSEKTYQRDLVSKMARRYLNVPFLWGGRSPVGIDGAGLVQMVFKCCGIHLARSTEKQVLQGEIVHFVEQAQVGDIAFFENNFGRVVHAGIILPDNKVLHAFGKVRIDLLDHYGIYDELLQKYSHRLRVVKSVLPKIPTANPVAPLKNESAQKQMALF
jgi:cell wall-associated NlpC family hydrolase